MLCVLRLYFGISALGFSGLCAHISKMPLFELAAPPLEDVEDRHFHHFESQQVRMTLTINL